VAGQQQGHMIWRVLVAAAATGRRPVGGIVSSLLRRRYVDCASDYSVDIASRSWFADPRGSQHQKVVQEYSSFSEAIILRK